MKLTSRNITGESLLLMEETCVYTSHPNKHWTSMNISGRVSAFSLGALSSKLEDFLAKMYKQNIGKGRDIMEQACCLIKQETATKLVAAENFGSRIKQDAEDAVQAGIKELSNPGLLSTTMD